MFSVDTIVQVTLKKVECCNCHMVFGMSEKFMLEKQRDHKEFYCPAGHRQYYGGKSDLEKMQLQLDEKERQRKWAEDRAERERQRREIAQRSTAAYKGQVTKIKNRVGRGVCPCCNRTFQNLLNHMKKQHPDFTHEQIDETTP